MKVFEGTGLSGGIAAGPLFFPGIKVSSSPVEGSSELERFKKAQGLATEELSALYNKVLDESGEETAAIFEIHQMLAEDEDFEDAVRAGLEEGLRAEEAVLNAGDTCAASFEALDDGYFKARATDIRDVAGRIARILCGGEEAVLQVPSVIAAHEITPGMAAGFPRGLVLGFVTYLGSATSHAAILARALSVPAVSGIELSPENAGQTVILDGGSGKIILEPSPDILADAEKKTAESEERWRDLRRYAGLPSVTKDGRRIKLYANMADESDTESVLDNDAEGVGLLRSEFLYMTRDDYPSEDDLFEAYKKIALALNGRELIIRTLDIGADKHADYFDLPHEENPALGVRAIRLYDKKPELLKTQLRAILRAAAFGNVSVMFPMIISVKEVKTLKAALSEAERELTAENTEHGNVSAGIMIETPAAVFMADELAREVDFFSIGTNDLTQYTLAADRQNPALASLYDARHPAVLRAVEHVAGCARKAGISVGICVELASDSELLEYFLKIGIDELSVSPKNILLLREKVRNIDLSIVKD